MPKYKVTKVLRLSIVVEAADESEDDDDRAHRVA